MPDIKLVIDTNIVIGLEDAGETKLALADLVRKSAENSVRIYVHEASKKDIERDKNDARKKSTLSKIQKFPLLRGVATPPVATLVAKYGPQPKANDVVDAILLDAVNSNIVDMLITEDDGLHRRANRAGLGDRVFTVAEAVDWIRKTFEPEQVSLPAVEAIKAYGLDQSDPIFDGLRADYAGFDAWLEKCRAQHRNCWVIRDSGSLAALIIYNDEDYASAQTRHRGPKIMKICTFKVSEGHQGRKLGEQLLKQVLWHGQRNQYDLLYVTAFPKQTALIRLLEDYGFQKEGTRQNGERVFEKPIGQGAVAVIPGHSVLDADRRNYPRFADSVDVRKFIVPIRPPYHHLLFPEFVSSGTAGRPGNTIRKVYLCRAVTNQLRSGDLLFFYMSRGSGYGSQCISSVGIIEQVRHTGDLEQVIRWTAKRSVYPVNELAEMVDAKGTPLKIIDFLLVGHVGPAIGLDQLIHEGILRAAPQSICKLVETQYQRLKPYLNLGFTF